MRLRRGGAASLAGSTSFNWILRLAIAHILPGGLV
jgi:hypothetical protein